jgi:hypothetical protein
VYISLCTTHQLVRVVASWWLSAEGHAARRRQHMEAAGQVWSVVVVSALVGPAVSIAIDRSAAAGTYTRGIRCLDASCYTASGASYHTAYITASCLLASCIEIPPSLTLTTTTRGGLLLDSVWLKSQVERNRSVPVLLLFGYKVTITE